MIRCLSSEQLEQLLTGQADALSLELMEAHLDVCARCRQNFVALTEPTDPELWRAAALPVGALAAADVAFLETLKDPPADAPDGRVGRGVVTSERLLGEPAANGVAEPLVQKKPPVRVPFPQIPGFEILSELGRGGMGVVYKALQSAHDRIVALKMIGAGHQASPEDLGRFHDEAEAIARLRHPHIVQIFEVGQVDSRLYFVLEFVEGGTLADRIQGRSMPPRSTAQLLESLARAMHYAHARGIVHRDLKPANVLLHSRKAFLDMPEENVRPTEWDFRRAMPKITDFGLAKLIDRSGTGHTASGDVVGTPSYMAPEQAQGKPYPIGPTTDVYSLGAILYEMLTGRPPFVGPTPMDTLFMVHTLEPVPPRKIVRSIPTSLETICLKCLHKDPTQRYPTAEEFAEDLRLFVVGQPIQARARHPLHQGWHTLRQKTGSLAFALLAVMAAMVAGAAMALLWWRGEQQSDQLHMVQGGAVAAERDLAQLRLDRAQEMCERGDTGAGLLELADVLADLEDRRDLQELAGVVRTNLALWSRQTPTLRAAFTKPARCAMLSADGSAVFLAGTDRRVHRIPVATGRPEEKTWLHPEAIDAVAVTPSGDRIVTLAAGVLRREDWPVSSPDNAKTGGTEQLLALSPNGTHALTAGPEQTLRLWQLNGASIVQTPVPIRLSATALAWDASGKRVLIGASDGRCILVEPADNWRILRELPHRAAVSAGAWCHDGELAVTASSDGFIHVWNTADGVQLAAFSAHPAGPMALAASRDGKLLLTGGVDRQVKLWRLETGQLLAMLPHPAAVRSVALADGVFLTLDDNGATRLWDKPAGIDQSHFAGINATAVRPALSPDGRFLFAVVGDAMNSVKRWDTFTGSSETWLLQESGKPPQALAVGSGGQIVLSGPDKRNEAQLAAFTGRKRGPILKHDRTVRGAIFRADGDAVLTWTDSGTAYLWDVATGKPIGPPITAAGQPRSFAVRADGKVVALAGEGKDQRGLVRVWSLEEKGMVSPPLPHPEPVVEVAWEAADGVLRTRDVRHFVRRWETGTGQLLDPPLLPFGARLVAMSPDGTRYLALGPDRSPRLYVGGRHTFIALPAPPTADWRRAAFSHDGQLLLTTWTDGLRLWDAATGRALGPLLPFPNPDDMAFAAADARGFLAWTASESRFWRLPDKSLEKAADWRLWLHVRTGSERTAEGSFRTLDAETWQNRRSELSARAK